MLLLREFNQLEVEDFSICGEELEYVLVADTPENRKKIDLALATHFNWAIIDMGNSYPLTAGGSGILKEFTDGDCIDIAAIIWNELPLAVTEKIVWSEKTGFILEENSRMSSELTVDTGTRIVSVEKHPNYPHATDLPVLLAVIAKNDYQAEEITVGLSIEQAAEIAQALLSYTE